MTIVNPVRTFITTIVLTFCINPLLAQMSEPLKVKELKLSNGLTVWLNEDHNQPKVFGAIVVKAGAKDCPDTGIAHYFEHMMFKGTDKIGTINYAAEKVILDSIAVKYDELAVCKDKNKRKVIQQEINDLSIHAAEYAIPNEFDRLISKYGGSQLNAGTSYDYTLYFNTFSPQYMAQWAELNSERLLNPVFRFFQSELETVYEEKNMYSDAMGLLAMEKLTERCFAPHPYAYSIIGSTENLKNPRLSQMREFFEKYYVASNMGLILCGDFRTEEVLPVLEKAFSRIRAGEVPRSNPVALPVFKGKEKVRAKLPIPFVKMMALGFRGVPTNHKDRVALNIAMAILNNENSTGYLDQLSVNRKIMAAMSLNQSLNEAGILAVAIVPKLMFQSYSSAEKLVWKEINRVKEGDFTEEVFRSLKMEQLRNYESALEHITARSQVMMRLYSQGKSWQEYIDEKSCIDSLTKENVAAVAREYFSENYLYVTKKTGNYPKNNLPKPDFAPIVSRNSESVSEYSKELEKLSVEVVSPKLIDFTKDVKTVALPPLSTLYITPNPINRIFTLNISYEIGLVDAPVLSQLCTYLPYLGTDSLSLKEFRGKLQSLGSALNYEVSEHEFVIKVSGFDENFIETADLVERFMMHVKADDKQLRQIIDSEKIVKRSFFKSSDDVAQALIQKVKFGDQSSYLKKLSLSDIKELTGKDLLDAFDNVKQTECVIHYCGTLSDDLVVKAVKEIVNPRKITQPSPLVIRQLQKYNKPLVYFFNDEKVSQSIVYGYICGDVLDDDARSASKLFTGYFGGDMSSLMFQEIREFRSYAYRVKADYDLYPKKYADNPGCLVTMLSTQSDKTLDALGVLDSLIKDMPLKPDRIDAVRQSYFNAVNNNYPSFRSMSQRIASWVNDGYTSDPNKRFLEDISKMDMDSVDVFYKQQVQGRPVVYAIVGNKKMIDMDKLSAYGQIVKVRKEDIFR